jgi:hypothetical protein
LLGIKREEIELDVMGVETFEQSLERKMKEAKQKGAVFDFCNSDNEDEHDAFGTKTVKVKAEKTTGSFGRAQPAAGGNNDIIDLCDSDDDEEMNRKPAAKPKGVAVKAEYCSI